MVGQCFWRLAVTRGNKSDECVCLSHRDVGLPSRSGGRQVGAYGLPAVSSALNTVCFFGNDGSAWRRLTGSRCRDDISLRTSLARETPMSSGQPGLQPVRPFIPACGYTHLPPSLLWPCGWLARLGLRRRSENLGLCVSAVGGCVPPLICRQDLPRLRPACRPLNDALGSISILLLIPSTLPPLFIMGWRAHYRAWHFIFPYRSSKTFPSPIRRNAR